MFILIGLLYMPLPVFSQQTPTIHDLIVNGGFEDGFRAEGVGYNWSEFSNGNAVAGWSIDSWSQVVVEGQSAQLIEIRNATELDRYAGIYQTVKVLPGKQYKFVVKGLIRSTEGNIDSSNYGYRLQYAVDYNGETAWELLNNQEWQEFPWDEQPLYDPPNGVYKFDTFETTITASSDKLTIFIRGWKKWVNNGSGIYNLDSISLIGPAPEGFFVPSAQAVSSVDGTADTEQVGQGSEQAVVAETPPQAVTTQAVVVEATPPTLVEEATPQVVAEQFIPPQVDNSSPAIETQLPVSGEGREGFNYIIIIGAGLILVLFVGAIMQRRNLAE